MRGFLSRLKKRTALSKEAVSGRTAPSARRVYPAKPVSRESFQPDLGEGYYYNPKGTDGHSFRIGLYRFLRNNIPVLNSAIWTWARLATAPTYFTLKGSDDQRLLEEATGVLKGLDRRLFPYSFQKFGGGDSLLSAFFNSLFTDGAFCGEVVLTPARDRIDRFYLLDAKTLRLLPNRDREWDIYQVIEDRKIKLNPTSTFYHGLDSEASDPRGRSILQSIPFVARIEQRLVDDMQKAAHNAGYYRLQISIKPPERLSTETEEAYVERANKYFDDTVEMIKNIEPDDNPVTWSDVEIKYIGPSSHGGNTSSWYLTHRAMVEDICAGCHLDPFMLGYSYGTTQTWAQFKYDIVLRNVISVQRAAKRFMEWLHSIELALHGFELESEYHFDNRKTFGLLQQRQAEKIQLENIIKKKEAGLVTVQEAKRELEG
jgi:hypothetical protein